MENNNKKVTLFWYSQTGNSYSCAERANDLLIKNNYNVKMCSILSTPDDCYDSDIFIFAFPAMQFYVPVAFRNFINSMPAQSKQKKAYAMITCAGATANIPYVLKQMLSEKNIELVNHLIIKAGNSFIFLRKIVPFLKNTGKPNEKSFVRIELFIQKNMIDRIKGKVAFFNPLSLLHWIGVKGSSMPATELKQLYGDRIFVKEDCTNCNICVALCPSGAITNGKEIKYNDDLCIGCCGCMNVCPTNAWQCSKIKSKHFYKGMNIKKLAEATGRMK